MGFVMKTTKFGSPFGMFKIRHVKCYHKGKTVDEYTDFYTRGPSASYWSISLNGKCIDTALTKGRANKRAKLHLERMLAS
jgi:hypothetical protein